LVNLDVLRMIRWIGVEPSAVVSRRKCKLTVWVFILMIYFAPLPLITPENIGN